MRPPLQPADELAHTSPDQGTQAGQTRHPGDSMPSRKLLISLLAASIALALTSAQAGIVSVSGAASQVAAPGSAAQNSGLESFTTAAVFNEQQNVTLAQAALVNATTSGFFNTVAALTPGSIAIGTLVSSHYLHADPVGSGGVVYSYTGSVTFDADILGVAALNAELIGSNFLGAPGTSYPGVANVNGIDYPDNTDSFTISADRRTLSFNVAAWTGADALRVITAGNAVPEPGTVGMALAALGALALTRRRQPVGQA
jgi:MYXO-CTERM domain-containing protein